VSRFPLVLALVALLAAPAARAESRRLGSFELGAGSYRPDVDVGLTNVPYATIFGSGRGWMFRVGASRALFTGFGSLEIGLRSGFFTETGKALQKDGTSFVASQADKTTFQIVPSSVTLTYRLDWFADRFNIPLAPYGRVALERYNWWVTDGGGDWAEFGATNGWSATGGLALLLDFFDRGMARELDSDTGVNHTYLFFDVTRSSVDDFGSSSSWDLSDEKLSLAGGLLFVF
jgi:hypothetical protein